MFIKKRINLGLTHPMRARLRNHGLHTVCEEASCPNISECFSRGTATFMILGNVCTRRCRFCGVASMKEGGTLKPPDKDEPEKIAKLAGGLGLRHVVITSVTRDDLEDEGAGQFADTIRALRHSREGGDPGLAIEVLTPDFHGRKDLLDKVCTAGPNVFNHNIETVRRLTPMARSNADYDRTLAVLGYVGQRYPNILVKSGLMVGLGERPQEVVETLQDLCNSGCRAVTIGQYLAPSKRHMEVAEYVEEEQLKEYKVIGEKIGLTHVFSGPFVRSSYVAEMTVAEDFSPPQTHGGSYGSKPGA